MWCTEALLRSNYSEYEYSSRLFARIPLVTNGNCCNLAAMVSETSDIDTLAQREALLLRLNDEIDADARALISDTERYLRDPPPVPPPPLTSKNPASKSSSIPRTSRRPASSSKATTTATTTVVKNESSRSPSVWPIGDELNRRRISSATRNFTRGAAGGDCADLGEGRRARAAEGRQAEAGGATNGNNAAIAGVRLGLSHGGGDKRQPAEATAAPRTGSSPLFRLSERVQDAARASGDASGRKAIGSSMPAVNREHSQGIARKHQTPQGESIAGTEKPLSSESETGHNLEQREEEESEDVENGFTPSGIGEEATSRFLKAKLSACQAQLDKALAANQSSQLEATELRKKVASELEHSRRLSRQIQQLQQTQEKDGKVKEAEAASGAALTSRVLELERELGAAKRTIRQADTSKKSLEVRLHRALEEVSKHKETTRQARGQNKELSQGQRLEVARLETQCRRLERQKLELLSAFKKQLKLIDVLKRQKFHVEAARLLAFTEEEFVKTLDWAS